MPAIQCLLEVMPNPLDDHFVYQACSPILWGFLDAHQWNSYLLYAEHATIPNRRRWKSFVECSWNWGNEKQSPKNNFERYVLPKSMITWKWRYPCQCANLVLPSVVNVNRRQTTWISNSTKGIQVTQWYRIQIIHISLIWWFSEENQNCSVTFHLAHVDCEWGIADPRHSLPRIHHSLPNNEVMTGNKPLLASGLGGHSGGSIEEKTTHRPRSTQHTQSQVLCVNSQNLEGLF